MPIFTQPMQIIYHGTNKTNANKILKYGFLIGTYFAIHLEDAIGYGGLYIFEVAYPSRLISSVEQWQLKTTIAIPPNMIVKLTKYNKSSVLLNKPNLRNNILLSNQS